MILIHIKIILNTGNNGIEIPIHYNHIVQGAIYHSIDQELAAFLHNQGFMIDNRNFKMFTFSRLYGRFNINRVRKTITFTGAVRLIVSSPLDEFCNSIVNTLLVKGNMRFAQHYLEVQEVKVFQQEVTGDEVVVRALSPVTVYSTMLRPDGRKYTCYFQPGEPDHEKLLAENLSKKHRIVRNHTIPAKDIKIKAFGEQKLAIVKYKDFVVKGYTGKLRLKGEKALLQTAVDSGLGSKNSQGFGCVEVIGR